MTFSCSFVAAVFKKKMSKKQTQMFTQGLIHLLFRGSTCPCCLTTCSSHTAGVTHLSTSTVLNDVFPEVCFCKMRRKDKDLSLTPHHLSTLHLSFTLSEAAKAQTVVETLRLLNARLMCNSPLCNERHHNSRASALSSPR